MESTVDNVANPELGQLNASEIKETTDFLESLAQALMKVHRLAGELSDARKEMSRLLVGYGETIRKRTSYKTLNTDPRGTNQSYSSEYINRSCSAAASNFWEYLAVLDENLAHQTGREGRNLFLTLREFKIRHMQGTAFDVSPTEKIKQKQTHEKPSKGREILHRLKASLTPHCRGIVSIRTNLERKSILPDPGVLPINDAATDLASLSDALRAMEDDTVSRVVAGLVQTTFSTIQDTINQGKIVQNVDACTKWNNCIVEKSTRQYSSTSAPEALNARASTPFDSGDLVYEATVDSGERVAVSCSDNLGGALSSDTHYPVSDYAYFHDSQSCPPIMGRPSMAKTEHSSQILLDPSAKGTPSRGNSLETFRTSISRESAGINNSRFGYNHGKPAKSSSGSAQVQGDANSSGARRGAATSLSAPCPRSSGHQRNRSVRALPMLQGSGTTNSTRRSFRRPRIPAVREEDVDGAMHEIQHIPNRSKAYSVLGIKGNEIANVERELERLVPVALGHRTVNESYLFPDRYGGSTWLGESVEDGSSTMQFLKLSAQKEHAELRRTSSYSAKASPNTSDVRRHSSAF